MKQTNKVIQLSDAEFIHWAVEYLNHSKSESKEQLRALVNRGNSTTNGLVASEFNRRGLALNSLNLFKSLFYIDQGKAFALNKAYPAQVNLYYKTVIAPIIEELSNQECLKNRELISYPFVVDQLYLARTISTISIDELSTVSEDKVFVFLRHEGVLHPAFDTIKFDSPEPIYLVFDIAGHFYNIEKVSIVGSETLVCWSR